MKPAWTTPNQVVFEDDAIKVLMFKKGRGKPHLIVPPQAGHHSFIVDYSDRASIVQQAMKNGRGVYCIEWKDCTFERRKESIEDLLAQLDSAVDAAGGKVHLTGLCQGGWLSAIYASRNEAKVASLTVGASPIDADLGESSLENNRKIPNVMFASIVGMGFGLMYGDIMLAAWKSTDPVSHYVERYTSPSEAGDHFYSWYDNPQKVAGTWYLWYVKEMFKANKLPKGSLVVDGKTVDLSVIKCPITVVTTDADDIVPPKQTTALLDIAGHGEHIRLGKGGHLSQFISSRAVSGWESVFKMLHHINLS